MVFLDYDGTLSPIVESPENAHMEEDMRSAVRRVAEKYTTAIVSGRSVDKVVNFVQLDELYIPLPPRHSPTHTHLLDTHPLPPPPPLHP